MKKILIVALLCSVQSITILGSGAPSKKVSVANQSTIPPLQPYNQESNIFMRPYGYFVEDPSQDPVRQRLPKTMSNFDIEQMGLLPVMVMTHTPLEQKLMAESLKMRYEAIYQRDFDFFSNKLQQYLSEAKSLEEAQVLLHNYMLATLITVRDDNIRGAMHIPELDLKQLLRAENQRILKQLGVTDWGDMVQAGDEQTKQNYTQRIEDMLFEFVRYPKRVDQRYPVEMYRAPVKRYAVAWLQYIKCYLDARWEAFNKFK
ncbi:hypothetical protein KBD08_04420 [Candidatus Babeliales bacterium]|nr:hypothetical protein [Candidatus Babeliales bacterium]